MTTEPVRWWDRLSRTQRVVAVVGAAVVGINLALAGTESVLGPAPGGPASSSFSTGGSGLEGYADLLRSQGHTVVRLQRPPTDRDLPSAGTVVLADGSGMEAADAERIDRFVRRGGRLVVAAEGGAFSGRVTTDPVDELEVWLPVDGTGAARRIAGDDGSRWADVGPLVPVAGAEGSASLLVGSRGEGRVIAFASASVLHNANLARADNAELALAAAGPSTRPVIFVEPLREAAGKGMAAVPSAWKWVAAGLGLTVLVGLWSAGARFGPPEPERRTLRPPRRDHVDAVAADLQRVSAPPADLAAALAAGELAAQRRRLSLDPHQPTDSPGATP